MKTLQAAGVLMAISLLGIVGAQQATAPAQAAQPVQHVDAKSALYNTKSDAAKDIAKALAEAKRANKTVLLQFGANWCGWCHLLHDLFASDKDIAAELKQNYVVVLVDVDKGHNAATNTRYGDPIRHGLPAIVVLDAKGKQLTTKDTGELEEGNHHSPAKVLAFLKLWEPKK